MPDCRVCHEEKFWKNHFMIAQQRFDKAVAAATIGIIIAFTVTVLCLVATICVIIRFQAFIDSIEIVEETEYEITQDEGINTAIIESENNEVIINGTEN